MRKECVLIGVESHLRTIMEVADPLHDLVDTENNKIMFEGQAPDVLNDDKAQAHKLRLYQRFETLARIVMPMLKLDSIEDKALIHDVISAILEIKRVVSINSELMQNHMEQRSRLVGAIMDSIEIEDILDIRDSAAKEQFLCL
jgi:hypothetical protein